MSKCFICVYHLILTHTLLGTVVISFILHIKWGGSGFGLVLGPTVSGKTRFQRLTPKLILFPLSFAASWDKSVPVSILRLGTQRCQNENI